MKNYLTQNPIVSLKNNQHTKLILNGGFVFSIIAGFFIGTITLPTIFNHYGSAHSEPEKHDYVETFSNPFLLEKNESQSFHWEGHFLTREQQWEKFTGLTPDIQLDIRDVRKINEVSPRIAQRYRISPQASRKIVREAVIAAKRNDVDPILLLAVVGVESRFNPYAASSVGAIGLTQVLPKWHPDKLDINNAETILLQTDKNLNIGAQILSKYLAQHDGDVRLALQKYNGALSDRSKTYAGYVSRSYAKIAGRPMPDQHY